MNLQYSLQQFREGLISKDSETAKTAFKEIVVECYPKEQLNPWDEWRLENLCAYDLNIWTGCAAAGKTHFAALWSFIYWLASPYTTYVVFTSTTLKMIRKRMWPKILQLHRTGKLPVGNLVASQVILQTIKGDDKHGILAKAVSKGEAEKSVADIQGHHADRVLLIIDEATDSPEAIFKAIPNLRKGTKDFRVIVIGNAVSHFDPHGRLCEPKDGWNSVTVDDEDWEVRGVDEWETGPGICLHFDGTKSPNIKAGKDLYPYLYTTRDLQVALRSGDNHIGFWKYTRGFWVPEGTCKTVFSEAMIEKFEGRGRHTFVSYKRQCAALDPAFGGDRCIYYPFEMGNIAGGGHGIQLLDPVEIPIRISPKEPVHYQIAKRVHEENVRRNVKWSDFGMDASGEGGGLADIITQEYNAWDMHRIEFGGTASDMPASEVDPRPCSEVYDRKVTELWFSAREFLQAEQLKGLKNAEIIQFCNREFKDEKRKIILNTKKECKQKIGHSPDEADGVVIACEIAKRLGARPKGITEGKAKNWLAKVRELDEIHLDDDGEDKTEYKNTPFYFAEDV